MVSSHVLCIRHEISFDLYVCFIQQAFSNNFFSTFTIDDGTIVTQLPPDPVDVLDVTDGIEKSVADVLS